MLSTILSTLLPHQQRIRRHLCYQYLQNTDYRISILVSFADPSLVDRLRTRKNESIYRRGFQFVVAADVHPARYPV